MCIFGLTDRWNSIQRWRHCIRILGFIRHAVYDEYINIEIYIIFTWTMSQSSPSCGPSQLGSSPFTDYSAIIRYKASRLRSIKYTYKQPSVKCFIGVCVVSFYFYAVLRYVTSFIKARVSSVCFGANCGIITGVTNARNSLYLYLADEFAVLVLLRVGKLVNLNFVLLNLLHNLGERGKNI